MHEATPGECTLCDRSCRYFIQNDFFCRLAGPVAPTGKAIVHWIGCINAIKLCFAIFAKNSKIQNGRHFWGGENFLKIMGQKFRRNRSISHS